MTKISLQGLLILAALIATSSTKVLGSEADDYFDKGLNLQKAGRYAEAAKEFSKSLEISPSSRAYFERGSTFASDGDQRRAIENYTRAIELSPNDGQLYGYRAYASYKLLDGPHTVEDASKAIELGFDKSYVRMARGAGLYWADKLLECLADLNAALNMDPSDYAAYSWRSLARVSLGQLDSALADANRAVGLRPEDPDIYCQRAEILELMGDKNQLKADYSTYLALTASIQGDSTAKAAALIGTGQPGQALAICDRMLSNSSNPYLYFLKGRALLLLKRYTESIPALDKYLAAKPAFARALLYKGLCLRGLGRDDEAIQVLSQAAKLVPYFPELQLQLGQALFDAKKYGEALSHANAAVALPNNIEAYKLRSKIYKALGQNDLALQDSSKFASEAENQIRASASAQEAKTEPVSEPIDDKWAIVVGISKFSDPKINLKCPAQDAKDFYNYLIGKAGFARDHVKLLLDEQATRSQILSSIGDKWLPHLAFPNDLVVIYVSTHGSPSEVDIGSVNYLVAYDTDVDSLYATGIPLQDLTRIIRKRILARRIVLILDACHSGAADAQAKGISRSANVDVAEISQGTGQLVLSSSSQDQQAWESKDGVNSVFTNRLLEALQVKGSQTTLTQVFEYLKEKVPQDVLRQRGKLQTPVMKSEWSGKDAVLSAPSTKPRPGMP